MSARLQLSSIALLGVVAFSCSRPKAADVAPARLQTWDHCRARALEPVNRLELAASRMGTVGLGDAGCDWLTASAEGGARVARRHKIFGTLLRFDPASGTTSSAPDVRVIAEQAVSRSESFEWYDDDGDGRHELERRTTFAPDGTEQRVEQLVWDDAGIPSERTLSTMSSAGEHVTSQRFVDGGWVSIDEHDAPPGCTYQPIVPMTQPPGK